MKLSVLVFSVFTAATLLSSGVNHVKADGNIRINPISALRHEISDCPQKSGGIYYAYPIENDSLPDPPPGYIPFAINHYGRHGSRWCIKEEQYPLVIGELQKSADFGNLTPLGENVLAWVRSLYDDAKGKSGVLSPLGEKQHKLIAGRLYDRFAHVFDACDTIMTYASIEPRCIVSMAAFCEKLRERNPTLIFNREVTPGNMDFISFSNPESKEFSSDKAIWKKDFYAFRDSVIDADRLMRALFTDPTMVSNQKLLMRTLHDIAIDTQDVERPEPLLYIFTDEELFALWEVLNYNMYAKHCYSFGQSSGPDSAASLLLHIVNTADGSISGTSSPVVLRFGHDTALIRLLALMNVDGFAEKEDNPLNFAAAWQDFKAAPMGANIQLILYRNSRNDDVLALLRHNEHPVSLPIKSLKDYPCFYKWSDLRQFWITQAENAALFGN